MSEDCINTCPPKKSRRPVKKWEEDPINCIDCGVPLEKGINWTEASSNASRRLCKVCYSARHRKYYAEDAEERRKYSTKKHYWQRYGLTIEEVQELKTKPCSICGSTEKVVIDHCHTAGHVRGVLCDNCNRGLGCFKDSPTLLEKAKEYLCG